MQVNMIYHFILLNTVLVCINITINECVGIHTYVYAYIHIIYNYTYVSAYFSKTIAMIVSNRHTIDIAQPM